MCVTKLLNNFKLWYRQKTKDDIFSLEIKKNNM